MNEQEKQRGKGYLEDYVRQHLKKSKGQLYQCPLCGSGSHGGKDSDGAFSLYPKGENTEWKCHACQEGGDIFTLVEKMEHLSITEAFQRVADLYQLENSFSKRNQYEEGGRRKDREEKKKGKGKVTDFSVYLGNCAKALMKQGEEEEGAKAYLRKRGILEETMTRFGLGRDGVYVTIPYNRQGTFFTKRNTNPNAEVGQRHRKPSNGGEEPVFNEYVLYQGENQPIFVVEGALCAISIMQEGGQAISVGGTGTDKLKKALEKKDCGNILVLAMDNDKAGQVAQEGLEAYLAQKKQPYICYNVAGEWKDPNESLQEDAQGLRDRIAVITSMSERELVEKAEEKGREEARRRVEAYEDSYSTTSFIQDFIDGIAQRAETSFISTGFPQLDQVLDGGLYEGLYVVGAISSLGKTTFSLQIADHIARSGRDVLYFSLEMARSEIIAKSISRGTLEVVMETGGRVSMVKTTRGITTGRRWSLYSKEEKELIRRAIERYGAYAKHLYIFEGIGNIGVKEVVERVREHIEITGNIPVVVIDYLQILSPYNERATDKQNTDKATLELKKMSRDYKIPVWAISSFNRENYTQPVNTTSFKESGAIEYSSDVLIGLQYTGMDYEEGEKESERLSRIRQGQKIREEEAKKGNGIGVEVKVLKNRNGGKGKTSMEYFPMFNFFKELPEDSGRKTTQKVKRL